jgi:hypothetical protein
MKITVTIPEEIAVSYGYYPQNAFTGNLIDLHAIRDEWGDIYFHLSIECPDFGIMEIPGTDIERIETIK